MLGNIIHYVLSQLLTPGFDLDECFKIAMEREKVEFNAKEEILLNNVLTVFMPYLLSHHLDFLNSAGLSLASETSWTMKYNELTLIGQIDAIYYNGDGYMIVDFKSSVITFREPAFLKTGLFSQLPFYITLTQKGKSDWTIPNPKVAAALYSLTLPSNLVGKEGQSLDSLLSLTYEMNGIFSDDIDLIRCFEENLEYMRKPKWFKLRISKDGRADRPVFSDNRMEYLQQNLLNWLTVSHQRIQSQDFPISPTSVVTLEKNSKERKMLVQACQHCLYRDICYVQRQQLQTGIIIIDKGAKTDEI
jgi:hypothetical protein